MPTNEGQQDARTAPFFEANVQDLASIIASEARGQNEATQRAVGWTVINRMRERYVDRVSAVWDAYAHNHPPTFISRRIAEEILDGAVADNSQGATHFYSPMSMPKEGESRAGFDVGTALESVPGVTKHHRAIRNYQPRWAKGGTVLQIPNVDGKTFKFFR